MKVSLNWLKDYVEIPQDFDITRIAHNLTMSTVEVEDVINLAQKFDNMVVGLIKEVLPHPNADKLRICKTEIGNGIVKDIVCGGSNVSPNMYVVVALPGAKVRWHGEGDLVEIKVSVLRGVESYGMICASSEIGLDTLLEETVEHGIVDLSNLKVTAGQSISSVFGLDDYILEIDNKSLTNRPDLWGHYGIARELSALYGFKLKEFDAFDFSTNNTLKIEVENPEICKRYMGVKLENVFVKPSPIELQTRLFKVGMRPINAIVDITNYVMLATGQPMHAFDLNCLDGNIRVRNAFKNEKLLVLNKRELILEPTDLVIADSKGAIALAGVIGGEKDSVLDTTNSVVIEIANFKASTIRKTSLKHEIRTESSMRNEKGIDSQRCDQALSLALTLFKQIYNNLEITAYSDNNFDTKENKKIDISLTWLLKRLGKDLPKTEIKAKLELLGFKVEQNLDNLSITIPSWRATGDISIQDDILEEVARMYGFEYFEAQPITTEFEKAINQIEVDKDRTIREYLAFRTGMTEIYSYPWMEEEQVNVLLPNTDNLLGLSTPPSPKEKYLSSTLIPNMVKAVANNLRYFENFKIFETAKVFENKNFVATYNCNELLPYESKHVAGALVGKIEETQNLFRTAKGILQNLSIYTHLEKFDFQHNEKPYWADNVAWLNIMQNGVQVGSLALLSAKKALDLGIKNSAVVLFELNLDNIKALSSRTNKFKHLPEFPLNHRDLSMLFDSFVKWEDIQQVVLKQQSQDILLKSVDFVDEYKGKQVPENKKSITLSLLIGSKQKTLTTVEIDSCTKNLQNCLTKHFGAEIR